MTKKMKRNIKNFILIGVTTLAFFYMVSFVFILSIIDVRNTLTSVIWCLCGIWLSVFLYANIKDDSNERRKGNK